MALQHSQTMSVEEYFQLEKDDIQHRYEYADGYVYMMAGGTVNHDIIKSNIERLLWGLLRGQKCRTYSSDMKVFVSETCYYYPDVTVSCDSRNRGTQKMVLAPCIVVEVLSPGTETTDRRRKLRDYLACPTMEGYLLVDSRSTTIELYRKEGQKWVYEMLKDEDIVQLMSIGVQFPLQAAYEDVDFEEGFSALEEKYENEEVE
jgi:Uma2 family endonuclease